MNSSRFYLFTHTNWLTVLRLFCCTRWSVSRSTPYFSICQNVCPTGASVENECDITYRSIRSATTLIRVHAVLDRISVASSILFVVHSNEAHFLFHFKFYHLSSNISIDSISLFNCFVSLSFQTKMCYVIQFYGHQIGSNVYGPMSFGLVLCC